MSRAVLKTHHLTGPRSFVRLRNRQLTSDAEVAWKCKYCYRCMHFCTAKGRYIFIPCRLCESPREAKRLKGRHMYRRLGGAIHTLLHMEVRTTIHIHNLPVSCGFTCVSLRWIRSTWIDDKIPISTSTSPSACITIISTNTPCLMQFKDSLQELQMKANSNPYLLESFPSDGDIYPNPNPRHKSRV